MIGIAWKSLCNRWPTALLAMLAIAMSVALILTVEKIRRDARSSFTQTVSGTDLIIGARSGAVQLLLYSVCLLYTSPSPRDATLSRMPSSA